jgi:hypothetical protein
MAIFLKSNACNDDVSLKITIVWAKFANLFSDILGKNISKKHSVGPCLASIQGQNFIRKLQTIFLNEKFRHSGVRISKI